MFQLHGNNSLSYTSMYLGAMGGSLLCSSYTEIIHLATQQVCTWGLWGLVIVFQLHGNNSLSYTSMYLGAMGGSLLCSSYTEIIHLATQQVCTWGLEMEFQLLRKNTPSRIVFQLCIFHTRSSPIQVFVRTN